MYYSLQYLSLLDTIVLTFLAPLCTGFSGRNIHMSTSVSWRLVSSHRISLDILRNGSSFQSCWSCAYCAASDDLWRSHQSLGCRGRSSQRTKSKRNLCWETVCCLVRSTSLQLECITDLIYISMAMVGVLGSTGAWDDTVHIYQQTGKRITFPQLSSSELSANELILCTILSVIPVNASLFRRWRTCIPLNRYSFAVC